LAQARAFLLGKDEQFTGFAPVDVGVEAA